MEQKEAESQEENRTKKSSDPEAGEERLRKWRGRGWRARKPLAGFQEPSKARPRSSPCIFPPQQCRGEQQTPSQQAVTPAAQ